jgi:hypothetical protein
VEVALKMSRRDPSRLRIRYGAAGGYAWDDGYRVSKLLLKYMEIIRFCEKDASFAGNRRGVVCPLAFAPADYLSARCAGCVGPDASQFAEQRAGIRFRRFPFETVGALRGRWTAIALENLPI